MNEPRGALPEPIRFAKKSAPETGKLSFTDYVRGLEPGEPPAREAFDQLQQQLRGVLVLELKRRSLWHLCPRCLGIFGPATWQETGAIEELVADCYCFVFLKRLHSLRAQLGIKANIDGLIFRSINNYLYDKQKQHDPLGFRIFGILRLAIRRCCDEGRLHVLAGDERVRNDTIVGFRPEADPRAPSPHELRWQVAAWNDDLLPELVTARGKQLDHLVDRLANHVSRLRDVGVEAFAFGRALELFKEDARRRWNAIWNHSEGHQATEAEGDSNGLVKPVLPDADYEQRQALEGLASCVSQQLEQLTQSPKTHDRLRRLWTFLRHQVAENSDSKPASRRLISSQLRIPRDSLPGLYLTLGRLVHGCQGATRTTPENQP